MGLIVYLFQQTRIALHNGFIDGLVAYFGKSGMGLGMVPQLMPVRQHLLDPRAVVPYPGTHHKESSLYLILSQQIQNVIRIGLPIGAVKSQGDHLVFPFIITLHALILRVDNGNIFLRHGILRPLLIQIQSGTGRVSAFRQSRCDSALRFVHRIGTHNCAIFQTDLHFPGTQFFAVRIQEAQIYFFSGPAYIQRLLIQRDLRHGSGRGFRSWGGRVCRYGRGRIRRRRCISGSRCRYRGIRRLSRCRCR